jgi:hypothetical protein
MVVGYLSNMPIVRYISIGRAARVKRGQVLSASTPRAPEKKILLPIEFRYSLLFLLTYI